MVSGKHAFWQALFFAGIIFCAGLLLGFYLETTRADRFTEVIAHSELSLLDQQLRTRVFSETPFSCESGIKSTFEFADRIYEEASALEDEDAASKFTGTLYELHKRYDLLRTLLWLDAITLRERCGGSFHTFVYFYEYAPEDVDTRALQSFYSRLLLDVKYTHPNEVLLIPLATNMNLSSVDMMLESYNIKSVPAILIDENTLISNFTTFENLEGIVFDRNKPFKA